MKINSMRIKIKVQSDNITPQPLETSITHNNQTYIVGKHALKHVKQSKQNETQPNELHAIVTSKWTTWTNKSMGFATPCANKCCCVRQTTLWLHRLPQRLQRNHELKQHMIGKNLRAHYNQGIARHRTRNLWFETSRPTHVWTHANMAEILQPRDCTLKGRLRKKWRLQS